MSLFVGWIVQIEDTQ